MAHLRSISKVAAALIFSAGLYLACTPKQMSINTGDNRVYNDDSEIVMKTKEKNGKMPFDTGSVIQIKKMQTNLQTE